jgi:hypothetical protein
MTGRTFVALLAGHVLVAAISWMMGYLAGRLMERRAREVIDLCDRVQGDVDEFIDLLTPAAPYDWAVGGECVGAER